MGLVDVVVRHILNTIEVDEPQEEDGNQALVRGITLRPVGKARISSMEPHPSQVQEGEQGEELLGSYTPMASPGILTLHKDKIASFFWHHVRDILDQGYYMDKRDLERLAYMTTIKTYTHERFHHFADVQRNLFNTSYDRYTEEALAVAHSYLEITGTMRSTWNSKIGLLPTPIYQVMLQSIFRFYQPGYKDWVQFRTKHDYERGLVSYLGPPRTTFLEKSGICVAGLLISMQAVVADQGVIEKLA